MLETRFARHLPLGMALVLSVACRSSVEPQADKLDLQCVEHPHEFSAITSLREMPDRQVLVADAVDRTLYALDFDSLKSFTASHRGSGPGEFEFPTVLLAMPSESTAVFDAGAGRYVMLDRRFNAQRSFSIEDAGVKIGGAQRLLLAPKGSDMFGNIYFERPEFTADGPLLAGADSATILRYSIKSHTATPVARVSFGEGYVRSAAAGKTFATRVGFMNPYAEADGWNVLADGRVAIVRPRPYQVEYISLDGRTVKGDTIAVDRLPVTQQDRDEVVGLQNRRPGRNTIRHTSVAARELDKAEARSWPREKPAFSFAGVYSRSNGELWVLRHTRGGFSKVVLDVFDVSASRKARVELPAGSVVLALALAHAYLMRITPDDLQLVRRCDLPVR